MRGFWATVLLVTAGVLAAQEARGPDWSLLPDETRVPVRAAWQAAQGLLADEGVTVAADLVVRVFPQEAAVMVMISRESEPGLPPRTLTLDPKDRHAALLLARALEAASRVSKTATGPPLAGPTLIDTFNLADLRGVDLPVGSYLAPFGLANRANGNLLVASFSTVLELDERWNLKAQPTKALNAAGVSNYAYGLTLTPSGTRRSACGLRCPQARRSECFRTVRRLWRR